MPDPMQALGKAERITQGRSGAQESAGAVFESLMSMLGGATGLPIGDDDQWGKGGAMLGAALPLGRIGRGKDIVQKMISEGVGTLPEMAAESPILRDPKEFSQARSLYRQTNGESYTGKPTDARKVFEIAKGRPGTEVLAPKGPSKMFERNLETTVSQNAGQKFTFQKPGELSGGRITAMNGTQKLDDALLGQIRKLGNESLKDLPVPEAARRVKEELGLTQSVTQVRDILRGNSFVRRGMLVRE